MKIYKLLLAIILGIAFISCEHDKLDTYHGQNYIYFAYAGTETPSNLIDSTVIRFGYDFEPKADSILSLKVKVMGKAVKYDRTVNYILVDTLSNAQLGTDLDFLSGIVPADSVNGYIKVKLHNKDILKDKTLHVGIRLVSNEHFSADFDKSLISHIDQEGWHKGTTFRIFFDAKSEMPNLWADYPSAFANFLGEFSRRKLQFICETVEVEKSFFEYDPTIETAKEAYDARFSVVANVWNRRLKKALEQYKEENNGNALLDENDKEITFP